MAASAKGGHFRDKKSTSRTNLYGGNKTRNRKKDESGDYRSFKVYTVLSSEDTNELMNTNTENIEKKLMSILDLQNPTTNLKDGIILDYFMEGIIWARDQDFTPAKFSGFFTVLHELLDNVKEKHLKFQENIKLFRKYYGGIGLTGVQQIASTDLFNIKEAKEIISYFCTTLFQHYALYEFVFTHTQAEEIIGTHLKIESPKSLEGNSFPALMDAASQSMFEKYKETSQKSEESEVVFVPIKDTLVPTDEEFELFQQLTKNDVQEVFNSIFSEVVLDVQPSILAALREKEHEIISRILHLCGLDD